MTRRCSHSYFQRPFALATFVLSLLVSLAVAQRAAAFCGFYVTGADSQLYANATMVVLMRDGTRTVLSMQNNYQGPPDAFALVIPVPTVLQKEQVKVLPKDVFQKVDALGAPRLVEYWEVDPCRPQYDARMFAAGQAPVPTAAAAAGAGASAPPVRIEAQFAVGEYDVVVLSADNSSALDSWLHDNKYNIPAGAAPVLAPYVAAGMKFFVAKVDPSRVTFNGNQAALSPLRFYYDTPDFSLPVRLGLLNSSGSQDLIVNILARERYEVANYSNVTVPTNIRVQNDVRNGFASFYEALYSRVLENNPRSVVTEYAWSSSSCDPCPTPPLGPTELATLGADVLSPQSTTTPAQPVAGSGGKVIAPPVQNPLAYSLTLTRLHARYTKDSLGDDLVFKQATGIVGGRGIPDTKGMLDQTVQPSAGYNNFQGRYVILHPWEGALACANPLRGSWGGPSGGPGSSPQTQAPTNSALSGAAPKAGDLPALLAESVPSLSVIASSPLAPLTLVAGKGAGGVAALSSAAGRSAATAAGQSAQGAAGSSTPVAPPTPTTSKSHSSCAVSVARTGNPMVLLGFAAALVLFSSRRRRIGALRGAL
jgi:hypothetical protein